MDYTQKAYSMDNMQLNRGSGQVTALTQTGLRAIDRLSEICKRLYNASGNAQRIADAVNGAGPQSSQHESENPQVTVSSLCGALDALVSELESQHERIIIGLGC